MKGRLVLEDKTSFEGKLLFPCNSVGEVVFNTNMFGYQEILTDPSCMGQIIVMTYPMIGNYGAADSFSQSKKSLVKGLVAGELCEKPSNHLMQYSFIEYLKNMQIPCLYGIDTRALTRKIRESGVMKGIVTSDMTSENFDFSAHEADKDVWSKVTTHETYTVPGEGPTVVVLDLGIKENTIKALAGFGLNLIVVPANATADKILSLNPDGVYVSSGPGNPHDAFYMLETVKHLIGKKPIFGCSLGHELIALAMGAHVSSLKFGHHGSNHPVKDMQNGRTYITSQNHIHVVDEKSLANTSLKACQHSLNDHTVAALCDEDKNIYSVQYYFPELKPEWGGSISLFDSFISAMKKEREGK